MDTSQNILCSLECAFNYHHLSETEGGAAAVRRHPTIINLYLIKRLFGALRSPNFLFRGRQSQFSATSVFQKPESLLSQHGKVS